MASKLPPAGAPDVLYVVDLSGYVFRAYHAIRDLSSPDGEPTNAVLGTVTMLERLVRECRPTFFCVAMDSPLEANLRKAIYAEYKANRPAPPPDLRRQMLRVSEIIEAYAIPIFEQPGAEADDVIATIVTQARDVRRRVVIVTADKDLMQLVGDDVLLWDTMRDRVVGVSEVRERFGVDTTQVRDLLALMGDASDNVPGVPSVGPKTARDLLVQFSTLEQLLASLDRVPNRRLRETLEEYREQALVSQRLVSLRTDCDLILDWEKLRYGGRDTRRLRQIYHELGFQRLLSALDQEEAPAPAGSAARAAPAAPRSWRMVLTEEDLEDLAGQIRQSGRMAVVAAPARIEPHDTGIAGIAVAHGPELAAYIPFAHRYLGVPAQLSPHRCGQTLGPLLGDPRIEKTTHDAKRLYLQLSSIELRPHPPRFDSLLAAYLLDPDAASGLSVVAERELGLVLTDLADLTKRGRSKRVEPAEAPIEEVGCWAASAATAALQLREVLDKKLTEHDLTTLFEELELPLCSVLAAMEREGVLLDTAHLRSLGVQVDAQLRLLEQQAHRCAGREFNVNSPRQLEAILFDELGLKPIRRTKTSRSTDADTLEALAEHHELPRILLEIRQLAKLRGTYILALPELVSRDDGRIHTSWDQAAAATGRISSNHPNLQNIPIRTELGRAIRRAFIARPGHTLVSADYSQIELRVLAHLAQDPVLLDAFRTESDVHVRTAMEIFGVDASGVTRELRSRAKAVNFGVIYGQGDAGLARSLGISRLEANNFIATYYRRHGGVRQFMDATLTQARASESVRSLLGRHRLLPDINSGNRARRLAAERVAMNMPIQGTAADLLKLAMLRLSDPITPGARMVLTVHDELVFEVPDEEVAAATAGIREAMENVYPLSVPLVVDLGHGKNWNDAH